MIKKRIAALAISSPIILTVLALMVITSLVGYAVNGKWELKQIIHQWAK